MLENLKIPTTIDELNIAIDTAIEKINTCDVSKKVMLITKILEFGEKIENIIYNIKFVEHVLINTNNISGMMTNPKWDDFRLKCGAEIKAFENNENNF